MFTIGNLWENGKPFDLFLHILFLREIHLNILIEHALQAISILHLLNFTEHFDTSRKQWV